MQPAGRMGLVLRWQPPLLILKLSLIGKTLSSLTTVLPFCLFPLSSGHLGSSLCRAEIFGLSICAGRSVGEALPALGSHWDGTEVSALRAGKDYGRKVSPIAPSPRQRSVEWALLSGSSITAASWLL